MECLFLEISGNIDLNMVEMLNTGPWFLRKLHVNVHVGQTKQNISTGLRNVLEHNDFLHTLTNMLMKASRL